MPYHPDTPFALLLLQTKGVGIRHAHQLIQTFGSAKHIFEQHDTTLQQLGRFGKALLQAKHDSALFQHIGKQLQWAIDHHIQVIYFDDETYPRRLRHCDDAPLVLFYRGTEILHRPYFLAVVGTRRSTHYGRQLLDNFMKQLASMHEQLVIVSGLAYGTDVNAHTFALTNNIPTIGVLAHGLDRIYPDAHRPIAAQMIENGGLLTEYPHLTNPDKGNFLARNRIIAGLCDATILVESPDKGGAIVTANIAYTYNRDVFAFPGRISDTRSEGCNRLIRDQRASLLTCADDILKALNWQLTEPFAAIQQKIPFAGDNVSRSAIEELLALHGELSRNELVALTGWGIAQINEKLLDLEMDELIYSVPGSRYRLA